MTVSIDKCKVELFIINNDKYTDFEIGKMFNTQRENGYDLGDDVSEVIEEIAEGLYKDNHGQFKFLLEIKFTYDSTYYYDSGWESDMDYEFTVLSKEDSDYFDVIEEYNEDQYREYQHELYEDWKRMQ
jgi:hypothetical protein